MKEVFAFEMRYYRTLLNTRRQQKITITWSDSMWTGIRKFSIFFDAGSCSGMFVECPTIY